MPAFFFFFLPESGKAARVDLNLKPAAWQVESNNCVSCQHWTYLKQNKKYTNMHQVDTADYVVVLFKVNTKWEWKE